VIIERFLIIEMWRVCVCQWTCDSCIRLKYWW